MVWMRRKDRWVILSKDRFEVRTMRFPSVFVFAAISWQDMNEGVHTIKDNSFMIFSWNSILFSFKCLWQYIEVFEECEEQNGGVQTMIEKMKCCSVDQSFKNVGAGNDWNCARANRAINSLALLKYISNFRPKCWIPDWNLVVPIHIFILNSVYVQYYNRRNTSRSRYSLLLLQRAPWRHQCYYNSYTSGFRCTLRRRKLTNEHMRNKEKWLIEYNNVM